MCRLTNLCNKLIEEKVFSSLIQNSIEIEKNVKISELEKNNKNIIFEYNKAKETSSQERSEYEDLIVTLNNELCLIVNTNLVVEEGFGREQRSNESLQGSIR